MFKHSEKIISLFCKIHELDATKQDVRVIEDDNLDVIAVGFYKDDILCWSSTLAEIALDALLEEEK